MASDSTENRKEQCWRIGGPVYMRRNKPCPECGAIDTHTPSSELRDEIARLRSRVEELEAEKRASDTALSMALRDLEAKNAR